ncbi:hypothetical protein BCR35DRAFT_224204 [Leucosporidium creatinivorum]|uniref:Uncharacterized protein n=1 Tax=Leucosporidium creatinivorum TaxID=106004 RepID=A0A1Y2D713_9BASI|nr:hypothetical protein BCR35DRAFT_224204 [Leucosporidium creatinivorum]
MSVTVFFNYDYRTQPGELFSFRRGPFHSALTVSDFPPSPEELAFPATFHSQATFDLLQAYTSTIRDYLLPPPRPTEWILLSPAALHRLCLDSVDRSNAEPLQQWIKNVQDQLGAPGVRQAYAASWFHLRCPPPKRGKRGGSKRDWERWIEARFLKRLMYEVELCIAAWDPLYRLLIDYKSTGQLESWSPPTLCDSSTSSDFEVIDSTAHQHLMAFSTPPPP